MSEDIDIVFSFDTTGSMSGCIGQVRKKVDSLVDELFDKIPGINIGIVSHGDYCDKDLLMSHIDISKDKDSIKKFIKESKNTSGGDFPEAYEYVLKQVQNFKWTSTTSRILVIIGDAYPHEAKDNPYNIDWRKEVAELKSMGITIFSVQCLNSRNSMSKTFYKYISSNTNGYHLYLDQFQYISEMMMAICFKQMSEENLQNYEQQCRDNLNGLSPSMKQMFDVMLGRESIENIEKENESKYDWISSSSESSSKSKKGTRKTKEIVDYTKLSEEEFTMKPAPPSRFQVLHVTEDISIKQFAIDNGLTFKAGRGFYEFTKPELIQIGKEIILQKKDDHTFYEGLKARQMLKLIDYDPTKRIKFTDFPDYKIFIQSTSYTRILKAGTTFLYDTLE